MDREKKKNHHLQLLLSSLNVSSSPENLSLCHAILDSSFQQQGLSRSSSTNNNNERFQTLSKLQGTQFATSISTLFTRLSSSSKIKQTKQQQQQQESDSNDTKKKDNVVLDIKNEIKFELAFKDQEDEFMRCCLLALQGIPTDWINAKSSNHSGNKNVGYLNVETHGLLPLSTTIVHSKHRLGSGALDALQLCGECTWMYQTLKQFITDSSDSGVVQRALATTIDTLYLSPYQHWTSSLHTNIRTIRQLVYQLQPCLSTLHILTTIVTSPIFNQKQNNSGAILSLLLHHASHGEQRHSDIVQTLLQHVSVPWYQILYQWTLYGILPQDNDDFFIVRRKRNNQTTTTDHNNNIWHSTYAIQWEHLPCDDTLLMSGLLSSTQNNNKELALQIYLVGKGINFIRQCLKDSDWTFSLHPLKQNEAKMDICSSSDNNNDYPTHYHHEKFKLFGFGYSSSSREEEEEKLQDTILQISKQVNEHILESLLQEHNLLEHLRALQKFLLVSQGDFICALLDGLHQEFSCPEKQQYYMHTMMGIVHDAIRTTNARFLPRFVLERLHVKLLPEEKSLLLWATEELELFPSSDKTTGWDIFSLGYDMDGPLTAIVTPMAEAKYQRVFTFLFRVKRIEWMLNSTWRQSSTLHHALQQQQQSFPKSNGEATQKLLRQVSMTRQSMTHFVSNLQSYLMLDVLESGWKSMMERFQQNQTSSLDDILHAHDDYLDEILSKSLLPKPSVSGTNNNKNNNTAPSTPKKGGSTSNVVEGMSVEEKLGVQLRRALIISHRFCKIHESIFTKALETMEELAKKRKMAEDRSKQGQWGYVENTEDEFVVLADNGVLEEMKAISNLFDDAIRELLDMLQDRLNDNSHNNDQETLRFLAFRLDFSDYYGRRRSKPSHL